MIRYPYKRGIISDSIRAKYGKPRALDGHFVRYEAHLNLASSTPETDIALLDIGFEPDDFVELFPTEYTRNFTFSFDIPANQDGQEHKNVIKEGCHTAMDGILSNYDDWAFVEAERFPSANIYHYGSAKINPSTLTEWGLQPLSVVQIPDREGIINEYGHTFQTKKAIDVHVKLRGIVRPQKNFEFHRVIDKSTLAAALQSLGMYRIILNSP